MKGEGSAEGSGHGFDPNNQPSQIRHRLVSFVSYLVSALLCPMT